jgi:hypothetical protein
MPLSANYAGVTYKHTQIYIYLYKDTSFSEGKYMVISIHSCHDGSVNVIVNLASKELQMKFILYIIKDILDGVI